MKKLIPSIFLIALGLTIIIIAAALSETLNDILFWVILLTGIFILTAALLELIVSYIRRSRRREPKNPTYFSDQDLKGDYRKKRTLLSEPEKRFHALLLDMLDEKYFSVYTQTALVSVIDKISNSGYRNELFRIVDFCIADAETSEPLLLIEINDASHNRTDRVIRDQKVKAICDRAGIDLITFNMGEAQDGNYVQRVLKSYL